MIDVVEKANMSNKFRVDSAAIGKSKSSMKENTNFYLKTSGPWHIGKPPDHRALATMKMHNLEYNNKARVIRDDDYKKFDYIFGMDDDNMEDLNRSKPKDATAKLLLLGEFDPQCERTIRDPYYDSDSKGFEKAYEQSVRCCEAFLKKALAGEV